MAVLKIRKYGDPVLRRRSAEVGEITPALGETIADMIETMYDEVGIGLAAPQVGVSLRLIVVGLTDGRDAPESERGAADAGDGSTAGVAGARSRGSMGTGRDGAGSVGDPATGLASVGGSTGTARATIGSGVDTTGGGGSTGLDCG